MFRQHVSPRYTAINSLWGMNHETDFQGLVSVGFLRDTISPRPDFQLHARHRSHPGKSHA
jgi:hypothetical protein